MRKRLDQLSAGAVLAEDVKTGTGQVLAGIGCTLEERHIGLFRTWGIASVDVQATPADLERMQAVRRLVAPRFTGQPSTTPVARELFRLACDRLAAAEPPPTRPKPAEPAVPEGAPPPLDLLVERAGQLGSLPDTWHRLSETVAKPTVTNAQIADVIAMDASLAARVLRLANSPMFGLSMRVSQISQAVNVIGTRQIRDLALASAVVDRFAGIPDELLSMRAFWRHSLAVGLCARALAVRRREANIERFLVAGLLHDVGIPVLATGAMAHQRIALHRSATTGACLDESERGIFGYDHTAVGAALLVRWRLPAELIEPVERHHAPAMAQTHRIACAAIHLADTIVDLVGVAGETAGRPAAVEMRCWDMLALPVGALIEVIDEVDRQLDEVLSILTGKP